MEIRPNINCYNDHLRAGNAYIYLILSLLSGVLETGLLIVGLLQGNIVIGLTLVFAYQIGCLFRKPFCISLHTAAYAQVVSITCVIPLLLYGNGSVWFLIFFTVIMSAGIQGARKWVLPKRNPVPISIKRLIRVVGFISGIIIGVTIGIYFLIIIAVIACLVILPVAISQEGKEPWVQVYKKFDSDGFGWIMLFHQTHYFAYAYVLLSILILPTEHIICEISLLESLKASLWFGLGWFTYVSGQWLFKDKFKMSAIQAAIVGHAWVATALFIMAFCFKYHLILALVWAFGGFGGGSVYAIIDLAKERSCTADMELWEHLGHISGPAIALLSFIVFPLRMDIPFIIAFLAVSATLLLLIIHPR